MFDSFAVPTVAFVAHRRTAPASRTGTRPGVVVGIADRWENRCRGAAALAHSKPNCAAAFPRISVGLSRGVHPIVWARNAWARRMAGGGVRASWLALADVACRRCAERHFQCGSDVANRQRRAI